MNQYMFYVIIIVAVIIIVLKQLNKITDNLDTQYENSPQELSIYASFSAIIQEKVRSMKADIDHDKNTVNPIYTLKDSQHEEKALEFLADTIRKLVFFETMNAKRKNPKDIEKELFGILSNIDTFIENEIQNGEKLADDLRDELLNSFNDLQNR